jgi:transposase-like protein
MFHFSLSHCDVEELPSERGIIVSYEAIRKWCRKFGQDYVNKLRRHRPRPGDKWHLDEMVLTINAEHHYFRPRRYLLRAGEYRQEMAHRFEIWQDITGTATA